MGLILGLGASICFDNATIQFIGVWIRQCKRCLSHLVEAFKRRETFLFAHVIQDSLGNEIHSYYSLGNEIYSPDWSNATLFAP
eukprot:UN24258